jgi:prevent-host-death family protein
VESPEFANSPSPDDPNDVKYVKYSYYILKEIIGMDAIYHAGKTELARNTRQIVRAAQRGQTVVIEHHGQPEVAIIDIADYHILRALAHYHAHLPQVAGGGGLSDEVVAAQPSLQTQYDLVLAYYLAEEISLSRAAELLGLPWLDLRTRFLRLDVPLRTVPADLAEAQTDVADAAAWLEERQP